MALLRVPLSPLRHGQVELSREAARYVLRVHRLTVGDHLIVFDPEAVVEADAHITSSSKDTATLDVGPLRPASLVPLREVTVVQGLAKGDKLDAVVRDATELGATAFSPALTARSIVDPKSDVVLTRWRRIAVEAARQCGRGDVPRISAPRPLSEIVNATTDDLRIVLVPNEAPLGRLLAGAPARASLSIVIGPEGGLDPKEVAACVAAGFVPTSLGRFILRTETACAAALGATLAFSDPR